jgi:uncharacterized lipoprotein YddW (UPF0748 family)
MKWAWQVLSGLLGCLLCAAGLFPASSGTAVTKAEPTHEMRAFWVDMFHEGAKTPQQVDQLIADVKKANANAIFVQVRRRGDAYYNNSLEPRTEDPALPAGYDPLQDLIDKAHASNPRIEVHAWFAMMPIWNKPTPPSSPNHVFNQHGPGKTGREMWLSQNAAGSFLSGSDYVLDPGHPDAADYLVDVLVHVAKNYDVDGIHLDLVRYMGTDWGYNPTAVQRFNQAYGRSGTPDPNDETWKSWRREQVNALVRQAYVKLLKVNPKLVVSAATIAWGDGPKTLDDYNRSQPMNSALQDWNRWLQEGWIDIAVPMNYFREHDAAQKTYYENWLAWEKDHQYGRAISGGVGIYLNSITGGLAQIRKAQAPSPSAQKLHGVHLYSYAVTNKDGIPNSEFYAALSQPSPYDSGTPVFHDWVPVPALLWKVNPVKGHLSGRVTHLDGTVSDGEPVTVSGPETRTVTTDGTGDFQAIELTPGTYTVTVGSVQKTVQVSAGQVAEVNLVR